MPYFAPARTSTRSSRLRVQGPRLTALAAIAAAGIAVAHESRAFEPLAAERAAKVVALPPDPPVSPDVDASNGAPESAPSAAPPRRATRDSADEDVRVGRLDPTLVAALLQAAGTAAADGIALRVTSGWRSPEHQARLRLEAVEKYGSEAEAARWVATPERSSHVSGDAVDIGPPEAATWLARHGAQYGLCRVYANEPWHFEVRARASAAGCPALYPDPTYDPRLQP